MKGSSTSSVRTVLAVLLLTGLTTSAAGLLHAQTTPSVTPTAPPSLTAGAPAAAPATTASDIRDIRGPKAVPSPELWMMEVAGAAALAGLAYAAWRWYRRVKLAPKTAGEIALARLEKALRLMQPETAREFSIEVSEIVRKYIEARFNVLASHQTTEEFLHGLVEPSDALLARHQELLEDFLGHCDLAKFARWVLSVEEMKTMHESARTFVLETQKAPASVPSPSVTTASTTQTLTPSRI
jgi:hypothetical protein